MDGRSVAGSADDGREDLSCASARNSGDVLTEATIRSVAEARTRGATADLIDAVWTEAETGAASGGTARERCTEVAEAVDAANSNGSA